MAREPFIHRNGKVLRIGALIIAADRWPWQAGYGWRGSKSSAPLNRPDKHGYSARFGGGWKYNLGFQFSGRTLLIELLFGTLRFNIETAKDRREAAENAARRKAEIDRILNRSAA